MELVIEGLDEIINILFPSQNLSLKYMLLVIYNWNVLQPYRLDIHYTSFHMGNVTAGLFTRLPEQHRHC